MPHASLRVAFQAVQIGGAVVILCLLAAKGPSRLVKIAALVYVAFLALAMGVLHSPGAALRMTAFALGGGALSMALAVLSWRTPVPRPLVPIDASSFPASTAAAIQRRSEEAAAEGLDWLGDRACSFRMVMKERRALLRFFATPDRRQWFYVHVLSGGKLVTSFVSGVTSSGVCMRLAGGGDDFRLFPTAHVVARTVPPRTSVRDMLAAHETMCRESGQLLVAVDDPIATHQAIYDRWVRELIDAGELYEHAGFAMPRLSAVPDSIVRQALDWVR